MAQIFSSDPSPAGVFRSFQFEGQQSLYYGWVDNHPVFVGWKEPRVSCSRLPLPPRLVGDLLHRREEILKDAARAEVDLGIDLHAGDEAQLPALAFEVAAT